MNPASLKLQLDLIAEEWCETSQAYVKLRFDVGDKALQEHLLKELADLIYVCHQAAAAFEWDMDEAYKRVHESNMSKLNDKGEPIYRYDGKILKGHNYKEPDLSDLV